MEMKEFAKNLKARLGCPCTEFPPMKDPAPIMAAYYDARKRSEREGFLPMLLTGVATELDNFFCKTDEAWEADRQKMLAQPVMDGKAALDRLAAQFKEDYAEEGWEWPDPETIGEMEGGEAIDRFLGISDYHGQTNPLVLAEIPVKHPWEVFALLPFGGWNECPCDEEQMAIAKYWFEKYGAVPAVMTSSVLEFDVPAPVKREEAMDLAMEQYTFCSDIVDQGCGTIGYLADSLSKSTKWFFWWD